MQVKFPYSIDWRGRSTPSSEDEHVREMIEQILLTTPGERVNRPNFGAGILKLVFEPGGEMLAGVIQMTVQGALQLWLGDLIQIEAITAVAEDSTLRILVQYTVRRTQEQRTVNFERRV